MFISIFYVILTIYIKIVNLCYNIVGDSMKRVVLFLTSIVLCLSITGCCFFAYKYYSYSNITKVKKDISAIDEKISSANNEIVNKNEEIENLKKSNQEKVNYLELWKRELNKVKRDS